MKEDNFDEIKFEENKKGDYIPLIISLIALIVAICKWALYQKILIRQ